jgi:hypothetical protein
VKRRQRFELEENTPVISNANVMRIHAGSETTLTRYFLPSALGAGMTATASASVYTASTWSHFLTTLK